MSAMMALAAASDGNTYRAAKRLVGACDRLNQLALVDSVREARARLLAAGVAL